MKLHEKAQTVDNIEDALQVYFQAHKLEAMCKEIKKQMVDFAATYMTENETFKQEVETETAKFSIGFTQPSDKAIFNKKAWENFVKQDLDMAKRETEREKARLQFFEYITPEGKPYIRVTENG